MEEVIKGTIYKIESKDYYLFDKDGQEIRCSLRGKFQKDYNLKKDKLFAVDIVTVGDFVQYELNKDGSGVINEIHPRKNHISRKAPRIKGAGTRGERLEQIIAANIDNLVIVSSCKNPKFNNRLIDRLLVCAESSHIDSSIVINKTDLDEENKRAEWTELYRKIGYTIIETSVINNSGLDKLHGMMNNKINLVWGQSGVGKSSLLNSIYPELNFKVGEISNNTLKGKHTTVTSVLRKIDKGTFIIDTPGIRELDPYGVRQEDLGHYFKEFLPFIHKCRFNTCTHNHEPGCNIITAVVEQTISEERYQSYLNLLDTIEDDMNF